MRSVRLHLTIPGKPSAAVYSTLADLGRDLGYEPSDFPISVTAMPGPVGTTGWEVGFGHGVLRWVKEEAQADLDRRVALVDGSWSCVDDGAGTAVTFAARLDLGVPTDDVETVAVRAFIDDAVGLMTGLFDGDIRVDDIVIQGNHPTALSLA